MTGQQQTEYDAIVIGSGITGGWAAKELTEKGLRTLMIERGRELVHRRDYTTEHKPHVGDAAAQRAARSRPSRAPRTTRSRRAPGSSASPPSSSSRRTRRTPYEEAKPFTWIQGDQVGGKSLIWGRQVYRWSDLDFEANLKDGIARRLADPLRGHRALVQLRREAHRRERRAARPAAAARRRVPPADADERRREVREGRHRAALHGSARDDRPRRDPHRPITSGRAACHYCGPCERGCSTGSYFSTQASTLPPRDGDGPAHRAARHDRAPRRCTMPRRTA